MQRDYVPLDLTEDEQLKLAMLISNAEDNQPPMVPSLEKEPTINTSNNYLMDSEDLELLNQQFDIEAQIATKVEVMDELHLSSLSESVRKILLGESNSSSAFGGGESNIFTDDVLNEIYGEGGGGDDGDHHNNNELDEFERISDLQNREITENDYTTLMTLTEIVPPVPKLGPKVNLHDITMQDTYNDSFTHKECMICLEDFEMDENILLIESCLHPFHSGCLSRWFEEKYECPICRISVVQN
jgi:hypothetical protein